MKRFMMCLAIVATVAGAVRYGAPIYAQTPGVSPAPAAQPMRPRIALVNIAKVLREFQKANADGKILNAKRQEYLNIIKPLREQLATLSRQIQGSQIPAEKDKLQKEALALNRRIEDVDREAQQVLGELTDKTIVDVYQNIKSVINDIAVTNNLDLVMCYPDASNPEDERKPTVAQLKLQTPALIPFYHRGMDITDVVVLTLNRRHPAPPTSPTTPGTGGAPAPMGGITPTGGAFPKR